MTTLSLRFKFKPLLGLLGLRTSNLPGDRLLAITLYSNYIRGALYRGLRLFPYMIDIAFVRWPSLANERI